MFFHEIDFPGETIRQRNVCAWSFARLTNAAICPESDEHRKAIVLETLNLTWDFGATFFHAKGSAYSIVSVFKWFGTI